MPGSKKPSKRRVSKSARAVIDAHLEVIHDQYHRDINTMLPGVLFLTLALGLVAAHAFLLSKSVILLASFVAWMVGIYFIIEQIRSRYIARQHLLIVTVILSFEGLNLDESAEFVRDALIEFHRDVCEKSVDI